MKRADEDLSFASVKPLLWSSFLLPLAGRSEPWQLLLQEASLGWGHSSPNPSVGCVIVDSKGDVLSSAHHQKTGEPHGEILALQKLGSVTRSADGQRWLPGEELKKRVAGATVYVTLEPCSHVGRTPSCAHLLAELPIKKVVAVLEDPNIQVSGQGLEHLRSAGIEVQCIEHDDPGHPAVWAAKIIHAHFLETIVRGRPLIWLKWASSYDGFMTTLDGRSQWLTSPYARQVARALRGICDGIVTTATTVIRDHAQMDLRNTEFFDKPFPLFIWDSKLACLRYPQLPVWSRSSPGGFYLVTDASALGLEEGAYPLSEVVAVLPQEVQTWARQLLAQEIEPITLLAGPRSFKERWEWLTTEAFYKLKRQSLWVEAGPRMTQTMIRQGCWHYGLHFQALKILRYGHGPFTPDVSKPSLSDLKAPIPDGVFAYPLTAQALDREFLFLLRWTAFPYTGLWRIVCKSSLYPKLTEM